MDKNINIHPVGEALEIRTGEALPLKEPVKVEIEGAIEAPLIWAETQAFSKTLAHCAVDQEKGKIVLYENARDHYGAVIAGQLKVSGPLANLGINQTKYYTPKALAKVLKSYRPYFAETEENIRIVSELNAFKAKVDTQIERSQNDRGSKKESLEKVVDSNAPESFRLSIPIFGYDRITFTVEVGVDVTDGGVRLWLDSVELTQLKVSLTESLIKDVVGDIRAQGITVLFI